jgi:hypothetical protein
MNEITFNVDVLTDYDLIQDINKLIIETVQLFNKILFNK